MVVGQRLMQSASDLFLGWSRIGKPPMDFYFRQLRDMKVSVNLDTLPLAGFINYAHYCGWAVARAHAKTGDAAMISGYLGRSDAFDAALRRFARAMRIRPKKTTPPCQSGQGGPSFPRGRR